MSNIYNRIEEYINSIAYINDDIVEVIRQEALKDNVPIIKRSTEIFLKSILSMYDVDNILEVGTATAYSSILMAKHTNANIITIEKYPKRIIEAKKNISRAGLSSRINIIEKDASIALAELIKNNKKFDFIFMDAAKSQYIHWLKMVKKLLKKRAVLLSDNIFQDNSLVESRYTISRRDRTIHNNIRQYLYTLMNDDDLQSSIIPVGDGVVISVLL